jgi:metal-responsive CopG/Arc/MetJ family transcriptional regulator
MPILSADIPEALAESIEEIAARYEVKRSVVIRWAVSEYVKRFFLTNRPVDGTIEPTEEQSVTADAAA